MTDHRIEADAKYCIRGIHMWVSVIFDSREKIDDLIAALTRLRNQDYDHVHIIDPNISPGGDSSCSEIILYGPAFRRSRELQSERNVVVGIAKRVLAVPRPTK